MTSESGDKGVGMRPVQALVMAEALLEGGGFPVQRPFPSARLPAVDPFLLLDHMGPVDWGPGEAIGAPDHPHRGFETVTYLLQGRMQHRDSGGHVGELGPGDVQWMTAGAGVVHSEMPHPELLRSGGVLHGFQLWVNLPASEKMIPPRYQEIPSSRIPETTGSSGKVKIRVIAGESLGASAVIDTRIPITYLHIIMRQGSGHVQPVPAGDNALVYVFRGVVSAGSPAVDVGAGQAAVFGPGQGVALAVAEGAGQAAELLFLAAPPLNEPVARWGPFVMNSQGEIRQAIRDYQDGKMGRIPPVIG